MADAVVTSESQSPTEQHGTHRLSAFLCWAVVFADIGTSVYYVPGLLWRQVQWQSGLFVLLTLVAFTLLIFIYAEVSVRFPEGGGVVTAAATGLAPWAGALGGMFILGSYFLTSAISSLSGLLYFATIFKVIFPLVLPITIIMVALLGLLNWWGIKESASVSAFIAVAALISDFVILLVVFVNVPLPTIGLVFEKVFSGQLGGVTLLTGFAGAFLAFSGLESISQLSPVMALPRRKTVSRALALVALTVGITSPLLTIFSTVLLNSPDLLKTTTIQLHVDPFPDTFISDLGGTYGGTALSLATALAASALLVFACNTAIIGAYHVFMALSRMGYLPGFLTATNAWRGTPHNAILLATLIPIIVLVGVRGQIESLGDLYAFGLLGAFTLTCLSMCVIRYRDRRGTQHIGAVQAAELSAQPADLAPVGASLSERLRNSARARMSGPLAARLDGVGARAQQRLTPTAQRFKRAWPTINFYLGIVTTILVGVAWVTNLFTKPLATTFGGGFTLLGVCAAVLYHQRLVAQGEAPVVPLQRLERLADALLVALSSASALNTRVIDAAIESADERQLVFLYLSRKPTQSPRFMQFADPYLTDTEAQRTLTYAQNQAKRAGLKASFVYRLGGAGQVIDIWRVIRPEEIIAEATIAQKLSKYVPPDYVRYQLFDGVRVAHYIRRQLPPGHQTPVPSAGSGIAVGGGQLGQQSSGQTGEQHTEAGFAPPQNSHRAPTDTDREPPLAGRSRRMNQTSSPDTLSRRTNPRRLAAETPQPEPEIPQASELGSDDEEWIWTGTDLIRKTRQDYPDDESGDS